MRDVARTIFALACALVFLSSMAAFAGETNIFVSNKTSGTVLIYRNGTQVCTIAAGSSCGVAVGAGPSDTLRFVFGDGAERSFSWDGTLHLCANDGGHVTNCAPPDLAQEY